MRRFNVFGSLAVALKCGVLFLTFAVGVSCATADDWPRWRGADHTDVSTESNLLTSWPESGPKKLWMFKDSGLGYSGFAVVGNQLFTMGARDETEYLIAIDVAKGEELWSTKLGDLLTNRWGDGPRGTPTVAGDAVYALGGSGTLVCADAQSGEERWRRTMSELGGKTPFWGYTESVLVDGEQVVCTPGGAKGAIAALSRVTGKTLWQTKDFDDKAQYPSIVPCTLQGVKQYVQLTMKHIVGVAAKDGAILWTSDWPGKTAVIPTPIVSGNSVYVSSGYSVGCKLIDIVKDGGALKAVDVYAGNKVMKNHHGGVIRVGEHLFGHSDKRGWVCQNFRTGDVVWSEKEKFGKGAIACAGGMLYCLEEDTGTVVLVEASAESWRERGRFTISPQTTLRKPAGRVWTHPVIANGRLYLRDQELIFCYDVRKP